MSALDKVYGSYAHYKASKNKDEHEQWGCANHRYDVEKPDATPEEHRVAYDLVERASEPHEDWSRLFEADPVDWDEEGDTVIRGSSKRVFGNGIVLKDIPGAGRVFDWRQSSWASPNGGRMRPLVFVQHIPVVPNLSGIADFIRLRDVLAAQGLMVDSATDRDGNVALYTPFDLLTYQARGANQVSCGCEHMHMSINEPWTEKQFRAAAWLVNLAKRKHGIPASAGRLAAGNGVARVVKRGQVTHQDVSNKAGFHDRTDPGPRYSIEHVRNLVIYYNDHGGSFEGAPKKR